MIKITSDKILKALSARHLEDFFMTEVKNGPTHQGSHLRMDAVAMKKSWANPCISAYEVKVSRGDFLQDNKWMGYLNYCNKFAFACPEGLIQKEELPPEVGLVWYTGEGKPLKFKRHSVYRVANIPVEFYQYIIMNKIQSDRYPFFEDKNKYFEEFIKTKKYTSDLGRNLSYAISKTLEEANGKVERIERRLVEYKEDAEKAQKAINILRKHGITWKSWNDETWLDAFEKVLTEGQKANGFQINKAIEHTKGALNYLEMIKGLEG